MVLIRFGKMPFLELSILLLVLGRDFRCFRLNLALVSMSSLGDLDVGGSRRDDRYCLGGQIEIW
jgi:hypothetical protein